MSAEKNDYVCDRALLHQINKSSQWYAHCLCGHYWHGTKAHCLKRIRDHGAGDHVLIGPRIIAEQWTISVPRSDYPGHIIESERWTWNAYHESDEMDSCYHGTGRTEWEAIVELIGINEVRRMARAHQNEGWPRNAEWLDFLSWIKAGEAA